MGESYAQLIIVLIIFVGVLFVTLWVTKWISGYQRVKGEGSNVQLIESSLLATGKYIQIVRIGDKYYALAVCKDSVTVIGEIEKDSLIINDGGSQTLSFKDILSRAGHTSNGDSRENENKE